jgi:hypothetical protein
MTRFAIWISGATAALAAALAVPAADEPAPPDNLDAALVKEAPKILKKLRDHKYANVGVLKFLVAQDGGTPRDNVGPLNRTLADRLEVALILAMDEKDSGLGIIIGAGEAVARSHKVADHRTPEGRAKLFTVGKDLQESLFKVPWKSDEKIMPDAFLTGEVRVSKDRTKSEVRVLLFDKDKPAAEPEEVTTFTAVNDPRTVTDLGLPYKARGGINPFKPPDDPSQLLVKVDPAAPRPEDDRDALQKRAEEQKKLLTKESPVELEILYGKEVQLVHTDPGDSYRSNVLLRVDTPKKGQEVTFRLTNKKQEKVGVVLRINGRSTIFNEEQDAAACHKWILSPKGEKGCSVTVVGFQKQDMKTAEGFRVLSEEQSEPDALKYGSNPGTIDLIVFTGVEKPPEAVVKVDRLAVARGTVVLKDELTGTDLCSLQDQLKKEGGKATERGKSRGLIVPGPATPSEVEEVKFYSKPYPDFSISLRYYALKK